MTYTSARAGSLFVPAVLIGLVAGVRQKAVDVVQNQTTGGYAYCVKCPDGQKIRVERPCSANAAWWLGMTATLAPHGIADLANFALYTAGAPLSAGGLYTGALATVVAPATMFWALGAVGAVAVTKMTKGMENKCADLKFYFEERENFLAFDMVSSSHLNQTDKAKLLEACLDDQEMLKWQNDGFPLVHETEKLKQCMTHESLCGVMPVGTSPRFSHIDNIDDTCPAKDETIRVDQKDILKAGTLRKLSKGVIGHSQKWSSRYIVLTRTHLYSFKNENDLKNPTDLIVRVGDFSLQDADETDEQTDENNKFQVVTKERVFSLAAETPGMKEEWMQFLSKHVLEGLKSE